MNNSYIQNNNNKTEEKVEIFSFTSTPVARRINHKIKKRPKRMYKINRKKKKYKSRSKFIDIYETCNDETEYDDKQKKQEEFIEIDIAQNLKNKQSIDDDDNNSEKSSLSHSHSNSYNYSSKESSSEEESENSYDIGLKSDPNYLSYNTEYIKYDPLKTYFLNKKTNNKSFETNLDENKLLPILQIPRIRPENPQDALKIREKYKKYNIIVDEVKENEILYYKGSFPLSNEKGDVVVYVPCYDDRLLFKKQKIFPELKKFDEDNDLLTDDEQLDLEIKREINVCLIF